MPVTQHARLTAVNPVGRHGEAPDASIVRLLCYKETSQLPRTIRDCCGANTGMRIISRTKRHRYFYK